jgi:hypothetical protein
MFILPEPPSFMMQILDSFCLSCKVLKCFFAGHIGLLKGNCKLQIPSLNHILPY